MKILLISANPEDNTTDSNIDVDYVIPEGFLLPN